MNWDPADARGSGPLAFDRSDLGAWRPGAWFPPLAGIIAGVYLTSLLCPLPLPAVLSWRALWKLAGQCTIPVFLASAAAVWLAARVTRQPAAESPLDVACAVSWLPAAVIFFWTRSPWASAVSVILGITLARALTSAAPAFDIPVPAGPLSLRNPYPATVRRSTAPVWIAAVAQAGAVACIGDAWRPAAVLLGAVAAMAAVLLTRTGVWPVGGRLRRIRVVPALFFAVTFSAGGLTRYLAPGGGGDQAQGSAEEVARSLFAGEDAGSGRGEADRAQEGGDARGVVVGDSYPGVIVWPETEPHTVLVPPLPQYRSTLFRSRAENPLSIPFFGAYWFYKGRRGPPKNAYVTHGDTAHLTFRSTDGLELTMEARQNLGKLIDIACCSAIEVAIRNADRRPGTVNVELALSNSAMPGKPTMSLGSEPVRSSIPFKIWDERPPFREVLTFRMPASRPIRQFDEIAVRFQLLSPRSSHSAKMAIDRFVLVPASR